MGMGAGVELGRLRRRCSRSPRNLGRRGEINGAWFVMVLQRCKCAHCDADLVSFSLWFSICHPVNRYHTQMGSHIIRRIEHTDFVILRIHSPHPGFPTRIPNTLKCDWLGDCISATIRGVTFDYEIEFGDTRQEGMSGEER